MAFTLSLSAQLPAYNSYDPFDTLSPSAGWVVSAYYDESVVSDGFSGSFLSALNNSEFIDDDMKMSELSGLADQVNTMRSRRFGAKVWWRSEKEPLWFFAGAESVQSFDSRFDDNLVALLMLGNKPFAGDTLFSSPSEYRNYYYNRAGAGVSWEHQFGNVKGRLTASAWWVTGQNYSLIQTGPSSVYTTAEGDRIDLQLSASIREADSAWHNPFQPQGNGFSFDFYYDLQLPSGWFVALNTSGAGSVRWSKSSYYGNADTLITWEGALADSSQFGGGIDGPGQLQYAVFDRLQSEAFTSTLPVSFTVSAGKSLANGKMFAGTSFSSLTGIDHFNLFKVWLTFKSRSLSVTPVISYNSAGHFDGGLFIRYRLAGKYYLSAGSAALSGFFDTKNPVNRNLSVRFDLVF
ncbi:MAG: hypothetical protein Kow00127_09940 [Bacteroidales bacterium]